MPGWSPVSGWRCLAETPPSTVAAEMVPDELIVTFVPAEKRPRSDDSGSSFASPALLSTTWSVGNRFVCSG